jgi:hypothetical protein
LRFMFYICGSDLVVLFYVIDWTSPYNGGGFSII